jgi:putative transposase
MARLAPGQRYPTDLTDARWELVRPELTTHTGAGAPTTVDLRQMVNAILYLTRTGCQWRLIPLDYGNWTTVRYYYDKWTGDGTWVRLNDKLRELDRVAAGRDPQPSAAVVDSQSVKAAAVGGERGYDAAKKSDRPQATHSRRHARPSAAGARDRRR